MSKPTDFDIAGGILKKYRGAGGDVVIPEGIKKIGEHAFSACSSITSVVIPEGVAVIGRHAFADCKSLASVTLPEGLRILEWGVFMGCEKLVSVAIPHSVTNMEGGVFRRCKALTSAVLPKGITEVPRETFWGCKSLVKIEIPENVTEIHCQAFYWCAALEHISFPAGLQIIEADAFRACKILRDFSIPTEQVFSLLYNYFESFYKGYVLFSMLRKQKNFPMALKKVKLHKAFLMELAIEADDAVAAETIFAQYKKIELSELDSWIEKSASAPKLKSFLLDYKAKRYSKAYLNRLAKIEEEKELGLRKKSIADWKQIFRFSKRKGEYWITQYKGDGGCVEIPAFLGKTPVVGIDGMAFFACENITSIIIPDGIRCIGKGAFVRCKGLADEKGFVIVRGVLHCYHGEEKHVVIPPDVKKIGYLAFSEKSAESITLPEGVEEIEEKAFFKSGFIGELRLPKSLKIIDYYALLGCDYEILRVYKGSVAEQYARDHDIFYEVEGKNK